MVVSLLLHGCAAVGAVVVRWLSPFLLALFPWCAADPQPILPESIEVAVVSLPKSKTDMPDRPSRVRQPRKARDTPAPVKEPPPVRESEVVHKTKTPPPEQGAEDAAKARADALADVLRDQALEDMDAPEGPVDRNRTSPDGVGDEQFGSGVGPIGDPEVARWLDPTRRVVPGEVRRR